MKNILVSEGAYIKEALSCILNNSTEKDYDRIFIGSKDTSKCKDLLHILNNIENGSCLKKEEVTLSLSCIISKCVYMFGNEEDIFLDLYLNNETISFIEESIDNELLYLPPKVFINEHPVSYSYINYINKEDSSFKLKKDTVPYQDNYNEENTDNNDTEVEETNDNPDKKELSNENMPSENMKTISDERRNEILAITKGISFEKDGYHFSKKQNDVLSRLIKSRKNFTAKEISDVTGINKVTIYNKRVALSKQKINQDALKDSKSAKTNTRRKDSTSLAKEEREKELNEIATRFVPTFDESTKKLSAESKRELKELFTDRSRNWSVTEICKATNLKKSIVLNALENTDENKENAELDSHKTDNIDESMFSYDFSLMDENILQYANQAGIFPSGNIIEDAENAMGISFSKEDRSALCYAFKNPISNEFDSDFIVTLNKFHFTYANEVTTLQPIFTMYKMICNKMEKNYR